MLFRGDVDGRRNSESLLVGREFDVELLWLLVRECAELFLLEDLDLRKIEAVRGWKSGSYESFLTKVLCFYAEVFRFY